MTTDRQIQRVASAPATVRGWLERADMQESLRAALAGWIDPATFAAQCYLAARDEKLAACSPESLFAAFLSCAQMGLLPGKHHGHVALIPRKGQVDAMPQWQGFKYLMERQPNVRSVRAVLVHSRDAFTVANGIPHHTFDPFDDARQFRHAADLAKGEASGLRGGYAVVEFSDGREPLYHFVSASKIDRNRQCAQTQDVWRKWFPEQCLKTVLRDVHARRVIPYEIELAQRIGAADEADNRALGNDPRRQGPRTIAEAVTPKVLDVKPQPEDEPPPTGTDGPRPATQASASDDEPADVQAEPPSGPSAAVAQWSARLSTYSTPQHIAASWATHRAEFGAADYDAAHGATCARLTAFASVSDPVIYLAEACGRRDAKAA